MPASRYSLMMMMMMMMISVSNRNYFVALTHHYYMYLFVSEVKVVCRMLRLFDVFEKVREILEPSGFEFYPFKVY